MTALEKINMLMSQIEQIKEKYCESCQAWTCENCWAVIEDDEDRCSD